MGFFSRALRAKIETEQSPRHGDSVHGHSRGSDRTQTPSGRPAGSRKPDTAHGEIGSENGKKKSSEDDEIQAPVNELPTASASDGLGTATRTGAPVDERIAPTDVQASEVAADLWNRIRAGLPHDPGGITSIGYMFRGMLDELGVTRGAVLTQTSETTPFRVWAYCGIDPTTRSRLRIPADSLRELIPRDTRYLPPEERTGLSALLSNRESNYPEPAFLTVARYMGEPMAVIALLTSPTRLSELVPLGAADVLSEFAARLADHVYRSRVRRLRALQEPIFLSEVDLLRTAQELSLRVREESGEYLLLAAVDIDDISAEIDAQIPCTDAHRVHEDVGRVVSGVLAEVGDICSVSGTRLASCGFMESNHAEKSLCADVHSELQSCFPELPSTYQVRCRTARYTEDDGDVTQLLKALMYGPLADA